MDILTSLQIAGALLSGVGGAVATFTDTRTEDKKRLTKAGWVAISLILSGMSLALISQKLANEQAQEDTAKVLRRLEEQAKQSNNILTNLDKQSILANQTLEDIERVVTPIKKEFSCNAIFELDTTNRWVAGLRNQLDEYLATSTNFSNDAAVSILDVDYWILHSKPKPNAPLNRLAVVRPQRLLNEPSVSSDSNTRNLIVSLMEPRLEMALSREACPGTNFDNISLTLPFLFKAYLFNFRTNEFTLYYALPSKRLFAHWQYNIPLDDFSLSKPDFTLSLYDVSRAFCYIQFLKDDTHLADARPFIVDMRFDSYPSITLESFQPSNTNNVFEASVPSENVVQHGAASRFFMPYPLTSKLYPQ